ncbi:hypothetical protein ACWOAH_11045 [Vagococcus vulneris]|uniref:Uncharacterized protein n=1 Tax=Vagococcus vulneris TaxID=1977869 RepID=A0A429ZSA4_9ENTE|nr:hypothetical protein [Vagococcus vulneris]RST96557.1 hypothetical protein CBF37_10935 [Vagococcus vulneris]
MAIYIDNYLQSDDISGTINQFITEPTKKIIFTQTADGYSLAQGTRSSQEDFIIKNNSIICILHDGATDTIEKNYDINEINQKYQNYEAELTQLVESGEQAASTTPASINTKNLTNDQAITWIRNYLIQTGNSNEDLKKISYMPQMSTDGYLEIFLYTSNVTGEHKTIQALYRIDENGHLQLSSSSNTWETVSTSYIE